MRRLPAILVLVLLAACRPEDQARSYWDAVRLAPTDADRVAAARALAPLATPEVAAQVLEHAGDFEQSEARDLLLATVARHRPDGTRWLLRRLTGMASLDEVFADVVEPEPDVDGFHIVDDPQLVDALSTALPHDPLAARWLGFIAIANRGDSTERVFAALEQPGPVRSMVFAALAARDFPDVLPSALFAAMGAPQDEGEEALLRARYRTTFAASLDRLDLADFTEYDALDDAFAEAFPGEDPPISAEDAKVVNFLREMPEPPSDDDEDAPPPAFEGPEFAETIAFLARHDRSGWQPVLDRYAEWHALPANALALVCRASALECAEALGNKLDPHPAAADVAPALDLPQGDNLLTVACDALEPAEARQLAFRGAGAGMALEVRESAANCLAVLGETSDGLVREVLDDAVRAGRWDVAGRVGMNLHEAVTPAQEAAALKAYDAGTVGLEDIEGLLLDDDRALELRQQVAIARERARPHRGCGTRRVIVLDDIVID